jgi:antibiotic biosynthesis monooxygenase (ABM) superfamily enzyme
MAAWVRAGAALAEGFPGFLGAGWVRPGDGSSDWHMLYRFADAASLAGWEGSPQRAWWLESARGVAETARTERRSGIEGWFDAPQGRVLPEPAPSAPPRWKQAVTIWVAFFPLSVLVGYAVAPVAGGVPLWLRTLATTLVMTPLMTYLVLPRVTRALGWWLAGRQAPWRSGRRPGRSGSRGRRA